MSSCSLSQTEAFGQSQVHNSTFRANVRRETAWQSCRVTFGAWQDFAWEKPKKMFVIEFSFLIAVTRGMSRERSHGHFVFNIFSCNWFSPRDAHACSAVSVVEFLESSLNGAATARTTEEKVNCGYDCCNRKRFKSHRKVVNSSLLL